jgi:amino acid transporter
MLPNANPTKPLGFFALVMINVIAVDSLRTLSIGANYGFSLVFYYLLIAFAFFIPNILISAELATGWPNMGGAYVWIREAFGEKWGFFAIWLQWVYNLAWFPTIFTFIGATLAYLIDPHLVDNKVYMLVTTLGFFWFATILSCFGIRTASWISTVGAIFGTLLPMGVIICFGISWMTSGKPAQIDFSLQSFLPYNLSSVESLVLLSNVLFGLMGIEISAVHAGNVKNPKKNYPRSLMFSGVIIFISLVLASLAITVVVPQHQINIVSGLMEAFALFFNAFHYSWAISVIAILIVIGSFAGVSAWILGPPKSLLIACEDMNFKTFKFLTKRDRDETPIGLLLIQAVIVTILCSAFLLVPSVSGTYWLLSALTVQLALPYYILIFAAAIRLRYKKAHVERAYRIPFGNIGIWICGVLGILSCIFTMIVGFFPPTQVQVGKGFQYEVVLISGILLLGVVPFILNYLFKLSKRN